VRVLLIHDQAEDAELIVGALQGYGIVPTLTRVETLPAIRAELAPEPEVVVFDDSVEDVPLGDALSVVREHDPDLPFILLSNQTLDGRTEQVLRNGPSGIVRKDQLDLLAPTIKKELEAARERRSLRELQITAARTERRFRALVERSADGIVIVDREARIRFKGPPIMSRPGTDLLGKPVFANVHPSDRERVESAFQRLVREPGGVLTMEYQSRHEDGSWRWIESVAKNLFDDETVGGVVVNYRDVTQRKFAEQSLRVQLAVAQTLANSSDPHVATQTILQQICEHLSFAVGVLWLPEEKTLAFSQVWCDQRLPAPFDCSRLTFARGAGLPGRVWESGCATWLSDLSGFANFPRAAMAAAAGLRSGVAFPILLGETVLGVLEFFDTEVRAPDQEDPGVLTGLGHQIGQYLQRQRVETQYRMITETARDAIITIDETSTIRFVNNASSSLFGYSHDELIGKPLTMLMPASFHALHQSGLARYIATGERRISWTAARFPGLHRDGHEIKIEMSFGDAYDAGHRVFTAVLRDVTDRSRLEEQLRHTQKLESLGVLAGGVAHDFNNLLTGILGNASLALDTLPPDSSSYKLLEDLIDAAYRAANLNRQLLAYAGKGRFIVEPVNLSALVDDLSPLLRTSIPRTVQLRLDLDRHIPSIMADVAQLNQVVMNLVINGAEAVTEGRSGMVSVTIRPETLDAPCIDETPAAVELAPGAYVSLEVQDTGCGMAPEVQARAFDPFFTTKFTGRGLGLSAVLGIVRGHHGTLRVTTTPGQGTIFKLLFPARAGARIKSTRSAAQGRRSLSGTGTILVVDDEEIVRRTATSALEHAGYSVLQAGNGREAIALFEQQHGGIDLVVLDMTMPVMSGEETLLVLRMRYPDVKVVLSSGYDEVEAIQRFADKGLAGFLQKPYTARTLLERVKKLLGGSSAIASSASVEP
jgi:PAS domain S-box-containing protein